MSQMPPIKSGGGRGRSSGTVSPHPDILIARMPGDAQADWDVLAPVLASALSIPRAHAFRDALPDDVDYGALFDRGYVVAGNYRRGAFEWIVQGMLPESATADVPMQELSARLGRPVCVDHSASEEAPNYVLLTPDFVRRGIAVTTREASSGQTYMISPEVTEAARQMVNGSQGGLA